MSFLAVLLPVLTVLAVGLVGSTRRLGFWLSLLASVVLTPIGGLIVALLSGPRRPRSTRRSPPRSRATSRPAEAS